jgi:hypothetical protein
MSLAELNQKLDRGELCVDETTWKQWLWHTDMHASPSPHFNRSHLLGLLIARHKAKHEPFSIRLGEALPGIIHESKLSCDLTLRQLRDAVEDLQMHWSQHCENGDGVVDVIDALWARFGELNLGPQLGLDDHASLDPTDPSRMSNAAIRRFTVIFCVLYRHLDLEANAVAIGTQHMEFDIQKYHVQAGLDAFYEHAMYADIPPASRITYKQDFAGMYHSITQVVFFHFPDYARKKQATMEQIKSGKSQLHCLSVALELRPDIPVKMEDEQWDNNSYNWVLLSGGKIYLVTPSREVWCADNLWHLLGNIQQG